MAFDASRAAACRRDAVADAHIGGDPTADGLHAGQGLAALVGDKPTTVVDLQGSLSACNGQERDKGVKHGIKDHPSIKIVSEGPTEWHPEPVPSGMEEAPDPGRPRRTDAGRLTGSAGQVVRRRASD